MKHLWWIFFGICNTIMFTGGILMTFLHELVSRDIMPYVIAITISSFVIFLIVGIITADKPQNRITLQTKCDP